MRRREFITCLGGAVAWPLAVNAPQPAMPVVGFLNDGLPRLNAGFVAAFRQGLAEAGYVEGQNVAIEFRWADNHLERLPAFAGDLVRRPVAVIGRNRTNRLGTCGESRHLNDSNRPREWP